MAPGALKIDAGFTVGSSGYSDFRLEAAIKRLTSRIARQTGIPIPIPTNIGNTGTLLVSCKQAANDYPALGDDESYELNISGSGAHLQARTETGVLRGLETFIQLIGPGPGGFQTPAVHIQDQPRYQWRGLMLDVARHWMPVSVIERNLDAMAAVKLNVFHWHLSDDQGFRVESRRYPRLQQLGSDGNFYSQAEIRQVVAYARDRGIRVVPEFDMPGHTTAWLVGYPELASAPGPYAIERNWGVFEPTLDPTRDETYAFLETLITEMAGLFPDSYFHIGGDEVNDNQWKRSPSIQAFARQHELTSSRDLQAYFNRRVEKVLKKHGKIMIGWDETLSPGLPADAVIESWRGQSSLADAAAQGRRSVLAFGYYLDHLGSAGSLYANDPLDGPAGGLSAGQAARILGGEACMWSEYVSRENIDSRIWPRMAAIAERFWSPKEVRDFRSMYDRLAVVSRSLEWVGVTPRSDSQLMLDRLSAGQPAPALRTLAEACEALGHDGRLEARKYNSLVPLNRFVDAVQPESELVRSLEQDVESMSPAARAELTAQFTEWAEVEIRLTPLAANNSILEELLPLARNLASLGSIGSQILRFLEDHQTPPAEWIEKQSRELDRIDEPMAEVRLAAVRPVRLLLGELRSKVHVNANVRPGNEPPCNRAATVLNWTPWTTEHNIAHDVLPGVSKAFRGNTI